jgi:hypothetical protein
VILLPSLPSLARRWLVAAVAAAGDDQNILPIEIRKKLRDYNKKINVDVVQPSYGGEQ